MRRRPWRSCTCYSSWLHRRPRGCRHSRLRHRRRLPCLPAVRCVPLHVHPVKVPVSLLSSAAGHGAAKCAKLPKEQSVPIGLDTPGVGAWQRCWLTAGAACRCRQAAAAGHAGGAGADAGAAGAGASGGAACCPHTAARLRSCSRYVRGARARACVGCPGWRHVR